MRKLTVPKVTKRSSTEGFEGEYANFPVPHYSYSSLVKFGSNPFMFKVNNINGEEIETTSSATNVLGRAMHKALEAYFGGGQHATPKDEGEAIKYAHAVGLEFLTSYSDGFVKWNATTPTREKLQERFAFTFFGYVKEMHTKDLKDVLLVEKMLKHKVEVEGKVLPVPLKGSADLVYRDTKDRVRIKDHKFTTKHSDPEAIDGAKLIQAAFNYFLVAAETGEVPYSMTFSEFKITKNADNSPQVKEFEIVYGDHPLIFQFFFRYYYDVTQALLGKQVYVPNVYALYDKEVAILAYIHRLDLDEEREKAFKTMQVDNITDFLRKRIAKDGSMKKYLETVAAKFVSAETLNYKDMTIEERIKMKLAEHGLGVEFHSKVQGSAVTLYRYEPSVGLKMSKIEAFVKDIEQVVEVSGVRILAPIPNSGFVGFEVPVPTKDRTFPSNLPTFDGFNLAIGVDIMGETVRMDIREAPHMLVAGATGSGKSVFIASQIKQLQNFGSGTAQLVLLDPKMVELGEFKEGVNTRRYESDPVGINAALHELVKEMNRRYEMLQAKGVKNLAEYNKKGGRLPYIFSFVDEYGDLIVSKHAVSKEIKRNILLLAQKARAAGIHVILTTQRPSVNIVDGAIKANFPTRVAFRTATGTDSVVIIDQNGAEKLLGKGDMLLRTTDKGIQRLQGFSS